MEQASLQALSRNPFAPTRNPDNRIPNEGFERALADVLARIAQGVRLTALVGAPGTGKTLLLEAARRAAEAMGPARAIARGDLLAAALRDEPATLLVDEGERADAATLARVAAGDWPAPVVIAFAQPPVADWAIDAVRLRPLTPREARAHLIGRLARTGRRELFTRAAMDAVIGAAVGNPRALSLIAGAALFAAGEDARGVDAEHVRSAMQMRGGLHAPTRARVERWPAWPRARWTRGAVAPGGAMLAAAVAAVVLLAPVGRRPTTKAVPETVRVAMPGGLGASDVPSPRVASLSPAIPRAAAPLADAPTVDTSSVDAPMRQLRAAPVRAAAETLVADRAVPRHALAEAIGRGAAGYASAAISSPAQFSPPRSEAPQPTLAAALPVLPHANEPGPDTRDEVRVAINAPSYAPLAEAATARDDARAAREAAMEARDAMQILRTARER